jgi:uncharacterized protein
MSDAPAEYLGPLPAVTNLNRPFWEGLRAHEVRAQRCGSCGLTWMPAGPWCPSCGSRDASWVALSGRGVVGSWVRYHQEYYRSGAFPVPYVVAEVTLEEGPRLYATLDDAEPEVGLAVEITFADVSADLTLPRCRPRG